MKALGRSYSLIVAEKNKVAKAIANVLMGRYKTLRLLGIPVYVGKGLVVTGVSGHVLNLDFMGYEEWRRDTLEELFNAKVGYKVRKGGWKYVKLIGQLARNARALYLALDNDVEGEHIGWEVLGIARRSNPRIRAYRMRFSSLDPREIRHAFEHPTDLNMNWVEKSATRQEVDLRSGVIFTRLLTLSLRRRLKIPRGRIISYGPCQSPTLRLIVEPYLRWRAGEKYKYELTLMLEHPLYGSFKFTKSYGSLKEAEEAKEKCLKAKVAEVMKVRTWREERKPPYPLDAYELASRAARFLKLPSRRTMAVAEDLYRGGFISYPRTETQVYRGVNLKGVLRRLMEHYDSRIREAAKRLLEGPLRPREGKSDDRAHPPIYPVRAARKGELSREHLRVYDLVVRHFIATLLPPARIRRKRADIVIGGLKLEATGLKVEELGYLRIYHFEMPKEGDVPLSEGDKLYLREAKVRKVKIKPRYLSEGELIKLMRAKGIGTDSTMHEHIQTNVDRGYAMRVKGKLVPTPLGVTLIDSLLKVVPDLVDVNLRSNMEKEFSLVGEGKLRKEDVVGKIMKVYQEAYYKLSDNLNWVIEEVASAFKAGKVRADTGGKRD